MILWNLVFFFEKDEISEIHDFSRFVGIYPRYPKNYRIKRGPPALGGFSVELSSKEKYQSGKEFGLGPQNLSLERIIFLLQRFSLFLVEKRSFASCLQQKQALKQGFTKFRDKFLKPCVIHIVSSRKRMNLRGNGS